MTTPLAPFQTSPQPNATDFYTFLQSAAGIPSSALPSNSPYLTWALSYSQELTLGVLNIIGADFYCFAVYLLGTSFLINWCPDQPGQTYFADLRKLWNLTGFVGGTVQSTADQGTSESLLAPDFLKGLTIGQLQMLKDPYGRQWLAMQSEFGPLWGLS